MFWGKKKIYKDEEGYDRFKDSGIKKSRWAASKKLGRPLRSTERVHHINRKKSDDRPSNLWVFKDQKSHTKAHKKDKKKYGKW